MTEARDPAAAESPPRWKYSNRITRREANGAIYFDFEGRMNERPALMGVYTSGWFRQYVFDPSFAPLVKVSRAAGERVFRRGLERAIEEALLEPAEHDSRR